MAAGDVGLEPAAVVRWLTELLGRRVDPAGMELSRPSGGGWSNDTVFVMLPGAAPARVVIRLAPTGPAMFPDYDLRRQCVVMQELGAAGVVPVPAVLAIDADGTWLGRPAFVMGFLAGRVPVDDRPSFAESGFLHAARPEDQREFHTGLLDAIADVHATAVSVPLVSMLGPGDRSALGASLDELERIWDFDRGEHWSGVVDDGLVLLRSTMPSTDQGAVLLWGDARPANVIVAVDGFRPVGLLDWELATIGPAELDVTWLAEMNRMRMEGSGVAPLPGFLDDDAAAVHYERRSGRPLHDLGWYQLHSATRIAVLMHRHLRVMVHAGRLPADHRLLVETIATRRLAELAAAFA